MVQYQYNAVDGRFKYYDSKGLVILDIIEKDMTKLWMIIYALELISDDTRERTKANIMSIMKMHLNSTY